MPQFTEADVLHLKMDDARYLALLQRFGMLMMEALEAEGLTDGRYDMRVEICPQNQGADKVWRNGRPALSFHCGTAFEEPTKEQPR